MHLLNGQGHRHTSCACRIVSLCMFADLWHLLLHRYFICSSHQQMVSFTTHQSSPTPKLCRGQLQHALLDFRLTKPLLDLTASAMGNLQH